MAGGHAAGGSHDRRPQRGSRRLLILHRHLRRGEPDEAYRRQGRHERACAPMTALRWPSFHVRRSFVAELSDLIRGIVPRTAPVPGHRA